MPRSFTSAKRLRRVPGDVDISIMIGRDRRPAIKARMELNYIALRLKSIAGVIESGIKHRRLVLLKPRFCNARTHPSHMHTIISPQRQVRAANCAERDHAAGLAVDASRFCEALPIIVGSNIERIAMRRIAAKVDQMNSARRINFRLWLQAAVWDPNQPHRVEIVSSTR